MRDLGCVGVGEVGWGGGILERSRFMEVEVPEVGGVMRPLGGGDAARDLDLDRSDAAGLGSLYGMTTLTSKSPRRVMLLCDADGVLALDERLK